MKQCFTYLFLFLLLWTSIGYAQYLQPIEKKIDIDEKVTPAWVLVVDEPEDAVRETCTDYAKDQLGVKLKKRGKDLLMAKEVKVPSISSYTGDLKIQMSTVQNQTQVAVAFMPGYDIALNSDEYPDDMENLRQFVRNMVKYHHVSNLQATIKSDKKRLQDLQRSMKKNQRESSKLDKSISRYERKINSDKTTESEKFDLKSDQEEARNRILTLADMNEDLESKIYNINEKIQASQEDINDIERKFHERKATVRSDEEYEPQRK